MQNWSSNRIVKLLTLIIVGCLTALEVSSQNLTTGRVTGTDGLPIRGVSVIIKGKSTGAETDSSGHFTIHALAGEFLIFSSVAHETKEGRIPENHEINIILPDVINNLNEVIVSGYVAEKVKNIIGSVSIVKPKELTAVPAGQVEPMLQGRVAGMNVITQATPGAQTLISIHGYGNLGDVAPLYIIDGIPGNINDLNPDDIQSLIVLKDAGSAAIYGVRGANGVIEIITRKGRSGNTSISFENYLGYQVPLSKGYDILNPWEMAWATWAALKNSHQPLNDPQYGSGPMPVLPDYLLAGNQTGLFEGDPATDESLYKLNPDAGEVYQIVKANRRVPITFIPFIPRRFPRTIHLRRRAEMIKTGICFLPDT